MWYAQPVLAFLQRIAYCFTPLACLILGAKVAERQERRATEQGNSIQYNSTYLNLGWSLPCDGRSAWNVFGSKPRHLSTKPTPSNGELASTGVGEYCINSGDPFRITIHWFISIMSSAFLWCFMAWFPARRQPRKTRTRKTAWTSRAFFAYDRTVAQKKLNTCPGGKLCLFLPDESILLLSFVYTANRCTHHHSTAS